MRLLSRKPKPRPVRVRSLAEHPQTKAHPYGEDRTWCSRCGHAAYVDDLSFHVWHSDDHTSANLSCDRPLSPVEWVRP